MVQGPVQKNEEENFDLSDSEYFEVWVDDFVEPFPVIPETPMDDLFDPETPITYLFDPMDVVREPPIESPSAYYSEEFGDWVVPDTPGHFQFWKWMI